MEVAEAAFNKFASSKKFRTLAAFDIVHVGGTGVEKARTRRAIVSLLQHLSPPFRQALVKVNSANGTATWFADPSTCMGQRDFAAAMRLRLGTAHPDLPAVVTCPGCGIQRSKAAWSQHVIGCTRVRGVNATTRHARLKDAVKKGGV